MVGVQPCGTSPRGLLRAPGREARGLVNAPAGRHFRIRHIVPIRCSAYQSWSRAGTLRGTVHPSARLQGLVWDWIRPCFLRSFLCGLEGAVTLGEETQNPQRNIPIAILTTCVLAGVFYVSVSYAQVIGFGVDATTRLANSSAPLTNSRYVSRPFGTAIDLAAAASAFSCALGSLTAAARLLFALGRDGLGLRVGDKHPVNGTPSTAILLTSLVCLAILLVGHRLLDLQTTAATWYDRKPGADSCLYWCQHRRADDFLSNAAYRLVHVRSGGDRRTVLAALHQCASHSSLSEQSMALLGCSVGHWRHSSAVYVSRTGSRATSRRKQVVEWSNECFREIGCCRAVNHVMEVVRWRMLKLKNRIVIPANSGNYSHR